METNLDMTLDFSVASKKAGNQSVAEWVASELRRNIAQGEFVPGDRLPGERQLSEKLNVSRVSVRAALQNLKAQGLLSSVQGGGTRVVATAPQMDAPLAEMVLNSANNLGDLIDLRAQLVMWSVERAYGGLQAGDLSTLSAIVEEMSKASQAFEISALDQKLQANLVRMTGTPVSLHLISYLDDILATTLFEQDCQRPIQAGDAIGFIQSAKDLVRVLKAGDHQALRDVMSQRDQRRRAIMMGNLGDDDIGLQQAAE